MGRGAEGAIPEGLGIVVGVDVDETGRHHLARSIDRPPRFLVHLADGDDATVLNAQVAGSRRFSAPIDQRSALDQDIQHFVFLLLLTMPSCVAAAMPRRKIAWLGAPALGTGAAQTPSCLATVSRSKSSSQAHTWDRIAGHWPRATDRPTLRSGRAHHGPPDHELSRATRRAGPKSPAPGPR